MRIRKRKVPLPLSLLSPVPLSDPHLFGRSPVLVQHLADHASQPSDHADPTSASDLRRLIGRNHSAMPCLSFEENERKDEIIGARQDVLALSNAMGAKSQDDHANVSISSQEKPMLVKKRPRTTSVGPTLETEEKDGEEERRDKNGGPEGGKKGGGGSKVRRGNTIMEGSRCSRVNGRGWRCCQPTLVGYSLCEHHLGKGRLRSMTSVRGRPSLAKKEAIVTDSTPQQPQLPPPSEATKGGGSGGTTPQAAMMVSSSTGKRVKLGVVKARSLSSLLGQTASTSSDTHDCQEQVEMNLIDSEIHVNDGGDQIVNQVI